MLTQERLKEILEYNPKTGVFTYLIPRGGKSPGDQAGSINQLGYCQIEIDYKKHLRHRLAWLYIYGEFPEGFLDHVNGITTDDRIENLREATAGENQFNSRRRKDNKSGFKGVHWHKGINKWVGSVKHNKKQIHVGSFDCPKKANQAVKAKREELHGAFHNHG